MLKGRLAAVQPETIEQAAPTAAAQKPQIQDKTVVNIHAPPVNDAGFVISPIDGMSGLPLFARWQLPVHGLTIRYHLQALFLRDAFENELEAVQLRLHRFSAGTKRKLLHLREQLHQQDQISFNLLQNRHLERPIRALSLQERFESLLVRPLPVGADFS